MSLRDRYSPISYTNLAGKLDHGLLLGLTDDDHTDYHTDGRANTWLAAGHETTYTHADIALNTTHRGLTSGNPHTVTLDEALTGGDTSATGNITLTAGTLSAAAITGTDSELTIRTLAANPGTMVFQGWNDTAVEYQTYITLRSQNPLLGNMDSVIIGATTPKDGTFTKVTIDAAADHTLEDADGDLLINSGSGTATLSSSLIVEHYTGDTQLTVSRVDADTDLCEIVYKSVLANKWFHGLTDSDVTGLDGTEFYIGQTSGGATPDVKILTDGTFFAKRYEDLLLDGWYQFSGDVAATETVEDSSYNNIDGTLVGNAAVVENVLVLDGTGDYMTVGQNFHVTDGDFAITLWVKRNTSTGTEIMVWTGYDSVSGYYYYLAADGTVKFWSEDTLNNTDKTETNETVVNKEWTHLVVTRDGTAISIYINGIKATYSKNNPSSEIEDSSANTTTIGRYGTNGSFDFGGSFADIRFYSKNLTNEEVQQIYLQRNINYGHFNELRVTSSSVLGSDVGHTHDIFGVTQIGDGGTTNYTQISATGDIDLYGTADLTFNASIDSSAVANQVSLGGYDLSAGNRSLSISQEAVVAAEVDETKFSHKMPVRINGSTYYIMLTAT